MLLSAFTVSTLNDAGAGSLRQAILDANANVGADEIKFDVAGTIQLTSGALANITDTLNINGTTAPGFAGDPLVQIDCNGFGGLQFDASASGSALRSVWVTHAAVHGVQLNGGSNFLITGNNLLDNGANGMIAIFSDDNVISSNMIGNNHVQGISLYGAKNNRVIDNYIGTEATGLADQGNGANGIRITVGASGNVIDNNLISGNDNNGVLLDGGATGNTLKNNIIGLNVTGTAALGNAWDGVRLMNADGNIIGNTDPVTGVTYYDADQVSTQPVSGWQGIRGQDESGPYLIVGTSDANGLVLDGSIQGVGPTYVVNFPGAYNTSVYGSDYLGNGVVRLVGSYKFPDYQTAAVEVRGFYYEGTLADLANPANYHDISHPGSKYNYVHSTMGGLIVGNYDSPTDHGDFNLPFGPGHAFIYNVNTGTIIDDVRFPGSYSNSVYGIWDNGDGTYTLVGGFATTAIDNFDDPEKPIGKGYMVDYNLATGTFSHWKSFSYPNGNSFLTHFQGISSVEKGIYTLSADSVQTGADDPVQGSWVEVRRNADGSFGDAKWVDLNYEGATPVTPGALTSNDSVYGNQVVGIVADVNGIFAFQATVNIGFTLSNVISGNGSNGIALYWSDDNQIAQNYIGTDITGMVDLGNGDNGIAITGGAHDNLIGGEATGGNNPTNGIFVVPPLGNLISGNGTNGVYLTGQAHDNQLSGNFIGTDKTGNAALGNGWDGVAIDNADNNALIGCTFTQDPFVFYNVISGNGCNGLRVTNSDDTTIQANFFGLGADNDTPVGNARNGVLVEGNSTRTLMGGPIPLGNVDAANGQNGILVKDTASFFTSYNTFAGMAAFTNKPTLGNGEDGMKITSTGGNILIRTNIISRNGDDGIEISGNATGVRVDGNIIGLNYDGTLPAGNVDNGVEVGGNAHDLAIGSPQPTFNVIPENTIGANGNNGVAIVGTAHSIMVNHSYIGTDVFGINGRGNANAGVYLGPGTYSNTIGSSIPQLLTVISGNGGNGVEMQGTRNNSVIGSYIGTNRNGNAPLGNGGNGVFINNSFNNVIGGPPAGRGDLIAFNALHGILVNSGNGNGIHQNSIYGNGLSGIDLAPGANNNQPAPVLTSVTTVPGGTAIAGTVTGAPNSVITVEFFANLTNDSTGRYYLGSITVTTNRQGIARYTYRGPSAPFGSSYFTATATGVGNNTSEFSAPVHL